MTEEALDDIDRRILELIERDGRLSGAEIGRRVDLSQQAASARLARLEAQHVIRGYRADIDPAALGRPLHAVVRLRTTHAHLLKALSQLERAPEASSILRLTGEDCLLVELHCADASRLESLVDSLARFGPVTTSLVLNRYPKSAEPDR